MRPNEIKLPIANPRVNDPDMTTPVRSLHMQHHQLSCLPSVPVREWGRRGQLPYLSCCETSLGACIRVIVARWPFVSPNRPTRAAGQKSDLR